MTPTFTAYRCYGGDTGQVEELSNHRLLARAEDAARRHTRKTGETTEVWENNEWGAELLNAFKP